MQTDWNNILIMATSGMRIIYPVLVICCFINKRELFSLKLIFAGLVSYSFLLMAAYGGFTYRYTWWVLLLAHAASVGVAWFCCHCDLKSLVYLKIWAEVFYSLHIQVEALMLISISGKFEHYTVWYNTLVSAGIMLLFDIAVFNQINQKNWQQLSWIEVLSSGAIAIIVPINWIFYETYIKINARSYVIFLLQIFSLGCAILLIYMQLEIHEKQSAKQELEMREQIWTLEKKHFEQKKEQIDLVNKKCHDLKYQISALQQISDKKVLDKNVEELKRIADIYDKSIQTDNPALETILSDKKTSFQQHGVILNCMVARDSMQFMDTVDLYILVGNLLDNAFEEVQQLEDSRKKVIEMKIFSEKQFTRMVITNYYENELLFEDDLPVTGKTEKEGHGFGLKSARQVVQKYGGKLVVESRKPIFTVKVMIPTV